MLNVPNTVKSEHPYIFILDIDGTMIGDISPQIMAYELYVSLKDKHFKINSKEFENKLSNGLIRPTLGNFIKKMKDIYHGKAEFFIYTSAEKQWTHFLIPHIERILGVKFNRPLFTRENCQLINGDYKKNLAKILPKIMSTLQKKYGKLDKNIIKERILVIDNNNSVYDEIDKKHLLVCPTYDFKIPENIPVYITEPIFRTHYQQIIRILNKNIPQLSFTQNYYIFQIEFYKFYTNFLQIVLKNNKINDNYFGYLGNVIMYKGITRFSPKTILYLQKKLGKKFSV